MESIQKQTAGLSKAISNLDAKMTDKEKTFETHKAKLQEDLGKMHKNCEHLKAKYKGKKEQFGALQMELHQTVPIDEFTRLSETVTNLTVEKSNL